MNRQNIVQTLVTHLRREEYGSAVQFANNELGDGRHDNVESIAEALDQWEASSSTLVERAFCFRSVYRSVLFEDSLRRAIALFMGEQPVAPQALEMTSDREQAISLLSLRLAGMDAQSMDEWLDRRWHVTEQVTRQWAAPKCNRPSRPLTERG
jgi:hypothetical protein